MVGHRLVYISNNRALTGKTVLTKDIHIQPWSLSPFQKGHGIKPCGQLTKLCFF